MSADSKPILKKQTYVWAAGLWWGPRSFSPRNFSPANVAALCVGIVTTAFAGYVSFWSRIHPKIYLGKGLAVTAFFVSAAVTYVAFSELAQNWVWRRTFQLTEKLSVYREPEEGWSVSYPKLWSHEEQRVSGTALHQFKPSRPRPPCSSRSRPGPTSGPTTWACRRELFPQSAERAGPADPRARDPDPSLRPAGLPPGVQRTVPADPAQERGPLRAARQPPLLPDGGRLPRWFDRQRPYLQAC